MLRIWKQVCSFPESVEWHFALNTVTHYMFCHCKGSNISIHPSWNTARRSLMAILIAWLPGWLCCFSREVHEGDLMLLSYTSVHKTYGQTNMCLCLKIQIQLFFFLFLFLVWIIIRVSLGSFLTCLVLYLGNHWLRILRRERWKHTDFGNMFRCPLSFSISCLGGSGNVTLVHWTSQRWST